MGRGPILLLHAAGLLAMSAACQATHEPDQPFQFISTHVRMCRYGASLLTDISEFDMPFAANVTCRVTGGWCHCCGCRHWQSVWHGHCGAAPLPVAWLEPRRRWRKWPPVCCCGSWQSTACTAGWVTLLVQQNRFVTVSTLQTRVCPGVAVRCRSNDTVNRCLYG